MARALAERGWNVLRFDPRGLGDSEGQQRHATGAELFLAIEEGLHQPDVRAAMDFVQSATDCGSFVVTGICGGAVSTVLAAANDQRVVGLVPMEMPLRYTAPPGTINPQTIKSYERKLFSARSWLRLLTLKSDYGLLLRSLAACIKRRLARRRHSRGPQWFIDRLGSRAHLELIDAFRKCVANGSPMLCAFAESEETPFFQSVQEGLFEGCEDLRRAAAIHVIAGADHDFSAAGTSEALVRTVTDWFEAQGDFQKQSPRTVGSRGELRCAG